MLVFSRFKVSEGRDYQAPVQHGRNQKNLVEATVDITGSTPSSQAKRAISQH